MIYLFRATEPTPTQQVVTELWSDRINGCLAGRRAGRRAGRLGIDLRVLLLVWLHARQFFLAILRFPDFLDADAPVVDLSPLCTHARTHARTHTQKNNFSTRNRLITRTDDLTSLADRKTYSLYSGVSAVDQRNWIDYSIPLCEILFVSSSSPLNTALDNKIERSLGPPK